MSESNATPVLPVNKGKRGVLRVACVQVSPLWQQPGENRAKIDALLTGLQGVDLVVLPEMFNTGFALNADHSEEDAAATQVWMQKVAGEKQCLLCGSLKVKGGNRTYNRFLAVSADGVVASYDKVHLFADENKVLSRGHSRIIFQWQGFRILPQICYDLRFPAFSRNQNDYDLALYVASWPKPRIHHWDALLKARAIENLSYVVGVNRVGSDGNHWQYLGHSQVISPMGEVQACAEEGQEGVIRSEIRLDEVEKTRRALPYLDDRDGVALLNTDSKKP